MCLPAGGLVELTYITPCLYKGINNSGTHSAIRGINCESYFVTDVGAAPLCLSGFLFEKGEYWDKGQSVDICLTGLEFK